MSSKKTQQLVRENERQIRSAKRDLSRSDQDLIKEEKRIEVEIKRLAAKGDKAACSKLAQQLIRVRKQRERSMGLNSQLTTISSQQRIAASTAKMGEVMGSSTLVMKKMNKEMGQTDLTNTMQEFGKAQMEMGMKEEMLDTMMDDIEFDEAADEAVERVLAELNLDVKGQLDAARVPQNSIKPAKEDDLVDLEAQLARLRE